MRKNVDATFHNNVVLMDIFLNENMKEKKHTTINSFQTIICLTIIYGAFVQLFYNASCTHTPLKCIVTS